MERYAKSISCDVLKETGAKVADFLREERQLGLSDARIAYFPDHGIFGGERVLDAVAEVNIGRMMDVSSKIAEGIISPAMDVRPAISIKDNILIFGGEVNPEVVFGL